MNTKNKNEAIKVFSDAISCYTLEGLNDIFNAFRKINGTKGSFTFDNITVSSDITDIRSSGRIYRIGTDYAYLELERIRKN